MITHTIESFWSQVKRRQSQSYKSKKFAKILKRALHETHLLKLLDKMCKYEMDLMSIVEDTEWTPFCPQTDRWTEGQTDKVIPVYPPFKFVEGGGGGIKRIEPIVFSKSSENPVFSQIFGHQRAQNEFRNMKMYRGQETHPIRINVRYEMNWAGSFFQKVPETPFWAKYLATRGLKMRLGTRKCIGAKRLTPLV